MLVPSQAATAAVLQFAQDALASYLAGAQPKPPKYAPVHQKALAKVCLSYPMLSTHNTSAV